MPIELFTGLPGNGKTAFMVERLMQEAKKAERPLFAMGIDGLAPGLATVYPDPREWNAVRPGERCICDEHEKDGECEAHVIPNGSLIFVDEAWKWFGHLHEAGRQATPPHVFKLAEHRHRGIDFVWTTQMPAQLYPFARSLIARHTHVVRRFGTQYVDLYSWEELNEEVKSGAKRENAQKQVRTLPKEAFDQYKSATLHTIKRRLPMRLFVLPAAVVASVALLWFGINSFRPSVVTERLTGKATDAAPAAAAALSSEAQPSKAGPIDVVDYIERQQPRIAVAPWSAPLYDDRPATADPQLFCMSIARGEGEGQDCKCLTEQGTRYEVRQDFCEDQARNGPAYNPFKERRQDRELLADRQDMPGALEARLGAFGGGAVGIGEPGFPARYGQFRDEPQGPRQYEVQGW